MNRSLAIGLAAGAVIAVTAGAIAGLAVANAAPEYAEVITSKPAFAKVKVTERICRAGREAAGSDCDEIEREQYRQVGYDVRYRLGERLATVRLGDNPGIGARFPVRDGRIVFTERTGATDPGKP
jgi:uncharacterized protein YcfJ